MSWCPCVRDEGVLVERVGSELVVYDVDAQRAHAVHPPAVEVFSACTGTRTLEEIAADLGLTVGVVEAAVTEFAAQGLLVGSDEPVGLVDRRRLLVGAAVLSVPLLVSVEVPAALANVSQGDSSGQLTAVNQTTTPTTGSNPFSVAFSADGSLLATANESSNTVSMFQVGSGAQSGQLTAVTQTTTPTTGTQPRSAAFSPDGTLLATANESSDTVSVFQVGSGAQSGQLTPVDQTTTPTTGTAPFWVAFSPDGSLLATANEFSDTVSVFQVGSGAQSGQLTAVTQTTTPTTGSNPLSVAFSPDGTLLATANFNSNTVSVFQVNATTGQLTAVTQTTTPTTGSNPFSVAFSPDGSLLATANEDADTVSVFLVGSGAQSGQLTAVTQTTTPTTGIHPTSVAFSPNGSLLATTNEGSSTVSVFQVNADTGQLTAVTQTTTPTTDNYPESVAFSPTDNLLATANLESDTVSVFTVS